MVIGWREKLRRLQNPAYRSTHRHFTFDLVQLDSLRAKESTRYRDSLRFSFEHWVRNSSHLYQKVVRARHQRDGRDERPFHTCHIAHVRYSRSYGAQYAMAKS